MSEDTLGKNWPAGRERRRNFELRERLDELLDLARKLHRGASQMPQDELDDARERMAWLAQVIWEAAVYGSLDERSRRAPDDTGEDESSG